MEPKILFCFLAVLAVKQASADLTQNGLLKPIEGQKDINVVISLNYGGEKEQYFNRDYTSGAFSTGFIVKKTTQFGYKNYGPDGITYGCYGLINPFGKLQATHYVADEKGYRVVQPEDPIKVYPKEKYVYDKSLDNPKESGQIVPWSKLFFPNGCGKNAGKVDFEQPPTTVDNVTPTSPENRTLTPFTWPPVTTRIPPRTTTPRPYTTPRTPGPPSTPRTPGITTPKRVTPTSPEIRTPTPFTWPPVTTRIPPRTTTPRPYTTPRTPGPPSTPRTPGITTPKRVTPTSPEIRTPTPFTWPPVTTRIPPRTTTPRPYTTPRTPDPPSTPCTPGITTPKREYPVREPKDILPQFPIYVINYTVPNVPESCPCYLLNPGSNFTTTLGKPPAQYPSFNQNQFHIPYGIIGFLPVVFVPYCPGNSNGMNIVQQNFQNAVPVQYNCALCQANRGVNRYVRDLKGEPSTNFGDSKEIHSLTELEDLLKQIKPMKKGLKRIRAYSRILDESNDKKNTTK